MSDNIEQYYKSVVKIISSGPMYDWDLPFRINGISDSIGTGFFIDTQGFILTCSHVVENAKTIKIVIPDEGKKEYDCELYGMCPLFDIALLRIKNYKNKVYLKLETNESNIRTGQNTYAVGFPLGQENLKITNGVISGQQFNYYQTSAAINPGNSGGPLMVNNKVIGINGAGILSAFASNVGFAVPISRYFLIKNLLKSKKKQIIYFPEIFGFTSQQTSPEMQLFLNSQCKRGGVFISKVFKNSPISQTHLKQGDILCSINNKSIDYYGELEEKWLGQKMNLGNLIATIPLNSRVPITYWNGVEMKTEHFQFKPYKLPIRKYFPSHEKIDYEVIAGLVVSQLSINKLTPSLLGEIDKPLQKYTDITNQDEDRVLLNTVLNGSYAGFLRVIIENEIIEKVNGHRVKTLADFRKHIVDVVSDVKNISKEKYVIITTESNKILIIPVSKILEEEPQLATTYQYPVSLLFNKLQEAIQQKQNFKSKKQIKNKKHLLKTLKHYLSDLSK